MSDESKSDLKRSEEKLKELVSEFEQDYYDDREFTAQLNTILNSCPELCEQKSVQSILLLHTRLLMAGSEIVAKLCHSFPLHCAVLFGAPVDLIEFLVANFPHALTEKVGINEETPLHLAANHFHDRAVFELLATPEAVRSRNRRGELPLHAYCEHHASINTTGYELQLDLVQFLVQLYPESAYMRIDSTRLPLHYACRDATQADLPSIQYLVESIPSLDTITRPKESTPLHVACTSKASLEIIHYLIQVLPDHVRALGCDKRTPLHELCAENYSMVDDLPKIRELVEAYPQSLALLDDWANTPLHLVSQEAGAGDIPVIQFLLQAYPEAQRVENSRGYTPLHVACASHRTRDIGVIRFLAQEGPGLLDSNGQAAGSETPLHILARQPGDAVPLKSYMEALGVSREAAKAKDNQGRIPLHSAVVGYYCRDSSYWLAKYCETVDCLLEAFPGGVSMKDNDGKSPLEYACEKNADLTLIYQLISINPIVTMGLESGRRQSPSSTRKRKRAT